MTTLARIHLPAMNGSPIDAGGSTFTGLITLALLATAVVVLAGRRRGYAAGYVDGATDPRRPRPHLRPVN